MVQEPQLTTPSFYIPHHGVLKPDSSTTKLRVVFDASAKDSKGTSLNDQLLTGPKLQRDIADILLSFRDHAVAFTADIRQMYRQILVQEEFRDCQRILWRPSDDDPVCEYRLNTVTYGVSSAPYLAIRTLHQLAADEKDRFPRASSVLLKDTYVDDVVTGAPNAREAISLQRELIDLLKAGGFQLRKFASNDLSLLSWLSEDLVQGSKALPLDNTCGLPTVKILGLQWQSEVDAFAYNVQPTSSTATKRSILSDLARIFDPLGWLSPVVLLAKCLIQHLWIRCIDWDDPPPADILATWQRFQRELPSLASITISRFVPVTQRELLLEIHGFSDSSEQGYAAVVYLRATSPDGSVSVYLLVGRSKVAPIKRVSLPRLELCGALLLARTMHRILQNYGPHVNLDQIFAWTDSTVVLHWIRGSPHKWKTFVANRVGQIHDLVPAKHWNHVLSDSNPADCASRGLFPSEIADHSLWWTGPSWLYKPPEEWPQLTGLMDSMDETVMEQRIFTLHSVNPLADTTLLERFSSLSKVKRITAYCLRFVQRLRFKKLPPRSPPDANELKDAMMVWVRLAQASAFASDIKALQANQPYRGPLFKLSPFLDPAGILRVGGRLELSDLAYNQRHPILLPKHHRLTDLVIDHLHIHLMHCGPTILQSAVQRDFWIVGARGLIRQRLKKCTLCFRVRPVPRNPPMGNLPVDRVTQAKPFLKTGVDYAGPFKITMSRLRKARIQDAYLCLFVCFATKAIHLELASDLTTDAFIAAFRRFLSRRGRCSDLHSDCGTNFVGASRLLTGLRAFMSSKDTHDSFAQSLVEHQVTWHFNPPSAPHFGGLWEAGVKSVKSLLIKSVGAQVLTYEELYTLMTQVEAILNSRPLCALSNNPNDMAALTPSHFLVLGPPALVPEPDLSHLKLNRLSRWQLIQQAHQSFWKRWHQDYLQQLQQRPKSLTDQDILSVGTLVLIKDPNLPPLCWKLGRIVKTFPGSDGVVRVAEVKTQQGTFLRPVVKLCPLPAQ
ncbi:uncharacterized protein LOC134537270 [Bacillus rossius redtenbacheri]|uniref:uncharacterized protein LOC134537270 n=1 Tax=Bacillus rossius redtenbacheri TaxID=93214 RepID=UPI002FDCB2D4